MDQHRFFELLQEIQIPDTQRVKAATSNLRKNYYPYPESLLWLLQILTTHHTPEARQQAAVESLRLVNTHWPSFSSEQKLATQEKLFQSILDEPKALIRHSSARVIASIAGIDYKDGKWAQLPSVLAHAVTSDQVGHREVGTYIIFSLLEDAFEVLEGSISDLFQLFKTTINDPESFEVRINTLLCLSRVAIMIEPDEEQGDTLNCFNEIFPSMVSVLKNAIDTNDEKNVMQAFDVFQILLGCESVVLNKHFKDLLTYMTDLSTNTNISNDSRCQALSFLMQSVKFRKMKIQCLKDMGELLTLKSLQVATEIDGDDFIEDDDDDTTPSKSALGLLDLLATSLPPRQVVVPLLKVLPQYVQNENPKYRQAGILALGMCVEGAPDFIATQIESLIPIVLQLLHDSDIHVRAAALNGVARLADDLVEDFSKSHETLIPALLKNLDSSCNNTSSGESASPAELRALKSSCGALDSVCRGMDKLTITKYTSELVPRLQRLLCHPDLKVKSRAAGALGSIAESAEDAFLPYFESSMKALSEYLSLKNSTEELDLRGVVSDSIGSIATAVGSEIFKPYVNHLMNASEEGLHLEHPRLRETSYIIWSTMAKIYENDFSPFLEGVVKSLFKSLSQDETKVNAELAEGIQEVLGQNMVVSGKKVHVPSKNNTLTDLDYMEDYNDDMSWDDEDFANTAVATEKEVAIEVLGDVICHTRRNFMPYFEEAVKITLELVEHKYDGVRKGAIGTLWRSYACLWSLMEDESGQKWAPGLPLNLQPSGEILKLGELITSATIGLWEDETNRAVVTDINRNLAATLKLCGPAILTQKDFTERSITTCSAIITKSHPCQQDVGDDTIYTELEGEELAEYDWLAIDTALDVIIALSKALGGQFAEIWKVFQKPVMKFASSQVNYERSTSMGVIAECIANMGNAVSPHTKDLLAILLRRLSDEDAETKSNAAYAMGLLIYHSTAKEEYLDSFPIIITKIMPLLQIQSSQIMSNAAGCICRMIIAEIDLVLLEETIPLVIDMLPLKENYEENTPIYDCISGLYTQGHPVVLSQTTKLLPIFTSILGEPKEQLEPLTREKIIYTVKFISQLSPDLLEAYPFLVNLLRENADSVSLEKSSVMPTNEG